MAKRVYKKEDATGQEWSEFLACQASRKNRLLALTMGKLLATLDQQKVLTQLQILKIVGVDAYRDMRDMEIKVEPDQLTRKQALSILDKHRKLGDELATALDAAGVLDLPTLVEERDRLKKELEEIKTQKIVILHLFLDKECIAVLISKNGKASIGWAQTDFQAGLTYYLTRGIEFPMGHPCEKFNTPASASSELLIRNAAKLYSSLHHKKYKFRIAEIVV